MVGEGACPASALEEGVHTAPAIEEGAHPIPTIEERAHQASIEGEEQNVSQTASLKEQNTTPTSRYSHQKNNQRTTTGSLDTNYSK